MKNYYAGVIVIDTADQEGCKIKLSNGMRKRTENILMKGQINFI